MVWGLVLDNPLCLIHFAPYRSHAIPLFNHNNILPRNFQSCKLVCISMHDVSNNSLPANISNLFLYPKQLDSYNDGYNTTSSNTRFSETGGGNIKFSRTNQLKLIWCKNLERYFSKYPSAP